MQPASRVLVDPAPPRALSRGRRVPFLTLDTSPEKPPQPCRGQRGELQPEYRYREALQLRELTALEERWRAACSSATAQRSGVPPRMHRSATNRNATRRTRVPRE